MNLQTIKSLNGKIEYVLLPFTTYDALRHEITAQLEHTSKNENEDVNEDDEYEEFNFADYLDNPVALARIPAGISQKELAKRMNVTQAYISKLENQDKVSAKVMLKVKDALK